MTWTHAKNNFKSNFQYQTHWDEQIAKDLVIFEKYGLMDYSLLLAIEKVDDTEIMLAD